MKIMVTGANGGIGSSLVRSLSDSGFDVFGVVRKFSGKYSSENHLVISDTLNESVLASVFRGVDVVVHTFGLAHSRFKDADYQSVDLKGTVAVANAARIAGVRMVIFISTVNVYGRALEGHLSEVSAISPVTRAAYYKRMAEIELLRICEEACISAIVLRCPMVLGPSLNGAFSKMVSHIRNGSVFPIPVSNYPRASLSIFNLVDLVAKICLSGISSSNVFNVSDGKEFSSLELVDMCAAGLGVKSKTIQVPMSAIAALHRLSNGAFSVSRQLGPLLLDISKCKQLIGWEPQMTTHQCINLTLGRSNEKQCFD